MSKQKTVIQELIETFEKDSFTMRDFYVHFMSRRYEFLELEKQQIENSFDEGYEEKYQQEINSENPFYQNGLDYYTKTFKKS